MLLECEDFESLLRRFFWILTILNTDGWYSGQPAKTHRKPGKSYTVNLATFHVFVYGLALNGKRLSLKAENRHKAPSRKMLSYPDFVPFRPRIRTSVFRSGRPIFRTKTEHARE
jgi:hypothetical protein